MRYGPELLGLLPDGTAIAYGYGQYGQTSVFHCRDLADIAGSDEWTVGKLRSGKVTGTPEWRDSPVDWDAGTLTFEDAFVCHEG